MRDAGVMTTFGSDMRDDRCYYHLGQACLNGHPINAYADQSPERSEKFCSDCGEPTITTCPACQVRLRGKYHVPGVLDACPWQPDQFCHYCGKPLPWTERGITAAIELSLEADGLNEAERKSLAESIPELVRNTPQAEVSATRVKKILKKVGAPFGRTLENIIVKIASETASKINLAQTNPQHP
jgi:hypothetical protein